MSSILRTLLSKGHIPVRMVCTPRCSISLTSHKNQDKPVVSSETAAKKVEENPMNVLLGGKNHTVDNLEKRFLVWSGKYKTMEDVPPSVPQETMEKARNKARIRIANYMILATVVACIAFVYSGKQAAKRGESVQKMNLDWHQQYKSEAPAK